MTLQEARDHMKAQIAASGRTINDWAEEIGVCRQFLSDALNRAEKPSPRILRAFGLAVKSKVVTMTYKRIDQ